MVGGAAQSPHWPQILADVTHIPISLPHYDTWPALGAAILAGLSIGAMPNLDDGLSRFQKPTRGIVPNEKRQVRYDEMFAIPVQKTKEFE